MRLRRKVTIEVRKIAYENDRRILVDWQGEGVWLRKTELQVDDSAEIIKIHMSRRYYKQKFGPLPFLAKVVSDSVDREIPDTSQLPDFDAEPPAENDSDTPENNPRQPPINSKS